jgi:hypothetical protein
MCKIKLTLDSRRYTLLGGESNHFPFKPIRKHLNKKVQIQHQINDSFQVSAANAAQHGCSKTICDASV